MACIALRNETETVPPMAVIEARAALIRRQEADLLRERTVDIAQIRKDASANNTITYGVLLDLKDIERTVAQQQNNTAPKGVPSPRQARKATKQ